MTSRHGEVDVELDGETLTLVFKFETLMLIEENLGGIRSIDEWFFSGTISRIALAEAVRCGLEKNYRKKTRKQVARMIGETISVDEEAFDAIGMAVVEGLLIANGTSKERVQEIIKEMEREAEGGKMVTKTKEEREEADPTPPVALTSTGS